MDAPWAVPVDSVADTRLVNDVMDDPCEFVVVVNELIDVVCDAMVASSVVTRAASDAMAVA